MSPRFSLTAIDWKKVFIGLLLALAGAVLTWVASALVPVLQDSGDATLLLVAAVLSALVNVLRKFLTSVESPPPE